MAEDKDYYQTLGVARDASQDDIQAAYRKLARKHHPDMNPDDKTAKEKFQKIQAAFDVLNDPSKRELYDRYGSSFESMGAGGPRGGRAHGGGGQAAPGFEEVDFSQLFGDRFGGEGGGGFADLFAQFRPGGKGRGKRAQQAPMRGADAHHQLEIPFATAVQGGTVELVITHESGQTETLSVKIPVGIPDGGKIRLRGQGGQSTMGGEPGDLLITVHVAPHPYFTRHGNDLIVRLPVTLAEAALGGKVDVPTPKGTIALTIPAGTSSGKKLRVKGHGVAPKSGTPGDLFAEVQIVLPDKLSDQTLAAIREHEQNRPPNPRADLRW
jgi:curved DNA-binding protein